MGCVGDEIKVKLGVGGDGGGGKDRLSWSGLPAPNYKLSVFRVFLYWYFAHRAMHDCQKTLDRNLRHEPAIHGFQALYVTDYICCEMSILPYVFL